MRTLAASFIGVGIVIFAALAFGLGEGTVPGLYLKTIANLGSLLPSGAAGLLHLSLSLSGNHHRRELDRGDVCHGRADGLRLRYSHYRRLDDATIRRAARTREALLILALALLAAPLRGWLAQRFHKLFEREAALYKEIVSRIGSYAGQYKELSDLLQFVEERTTKALGLRQLKIFIDGSVASEVNGHRKLPEPWGEMVLANRARMAGRLLKTILFSSNRVSNSRIRCVVKRTSKDCWRLMPRRRV